MRAAEIRAAGQVPVVAARPEPEPGPGEVAVSVTAAPITPLDLLCASGTSYFGEPATPYVPGVQGVGVLTRPTPTRPAGTPVWFATTAGMLPGDGSMAEHAAVAADDLVVLPPRADHTLVAALGLSAVAAWMSLTWKGTLAPGETVLVLGAGGVVGQAAVQLARLAGAGRVIACARSAAAVERAARLGADAVVRLEPDGDTLTQRLLDAAGHPVDLVVDPVFGAPAAAALGTLRPGGRLVNLGSSAGEVCPVDSATLRSRSLRILGYTNNELAAAQRREALLTVVGHAIAGELTVDYERVPLAEAGAAWARQGEGSAGGRIVLVP
ncbi:zinc-binding alcohol dehydrogenase family protein [Amycolatopsis sp. OK19-0408]|uniref:Zinc-binding alcohol dehydrogenase family protein n=1 Tax=Amycolatopsis iheyensis TaxID=2945988 RepID=A0A9X2N843_9PSEU|nr:zinc-binding alcohol dehydrogenase family protein [Amycolatopsis iheyensis]MCR6482256.1 zinc-binding alcohol dehydrogenase family protein [Amycolatopsis iheyensis]